MIFLGNRSMNLHTGKVTLLLEMNGVKRKIYLVGSTFTMKTVLLAQKVNKSYAGSVRNWYLTPTSQ